MCPSLLFPVVMVLAQVAADNGSVESVEAWQRLCNQAVSELMQGDAKGFETLKKAVAPEYAAELDDQVYGFLRFFEEYRKVSAAPFPWQHLGAKKIGTIIREDLYVGRHPSFPLFLQIGAHERNGRWSFTSICWAGHGKEILDSIPWENKNEDRSHVKLCNEIVELVVQGKSEAADLMKKSFNVQDRLLNEQIPREVQRCSGHLLQGGRPLKRELLYAKDVAGVIGECCYALEHERAWTLVRFHLYRPGKDWKISGFTWNRDYPELLGKVSLEIDPPSPSAQLARPPQTNQGSNAKPPLR